MNHVLTHEDKCTGCRACVDICPVSCISMQENDEGFRYPKIDLAECIHCNLCRKKCPVITSEIICEEDVFPLQAFAVKNKDTSIRLKSSSGGVFSLLAEYIISVGGVVFGAALSDDCKNVRHICVEDKENLEKIYKSKYVESSLENSYTMVKKNLEQGRWVLFSGTPCQIEGLYAYLGDTPYDKLLTQDLICHGVPSPKIWKWYVDILEEKYFSKIKHFYFRTKTPNWENCNVEGAFYNGKIYTGTRETDLFRQGFINNIFLRPSCYQCKFKKKYRKSDITLADFWKVKKIFPDFFDEQGVSLVIISSKRGQAFFEHIQNSMEKQECSADLIAECNPSWLFSEKKPENREDFFRHLTKENLEYKLCRACIEPAMFTALQNDFNKTSKVDVIIFGVGGLLKKNKTFIDTDKYKILEYWDNNSSLNGTIYDHQAPIKLPYAKQEKAARIIIMSMYFNEIREQLLELGYSESIIFDSKYFIKSKLYQRFVAEKETKTDEVF